MPPVFVLGLLDLVFTIGEALLPQAQELFKRGEITVEQQSKVWTQYQSLKNKADKQFSGPEWKIEP